MALLNAANPRELRIAAYAHVSWLTSYLTPLRDAKAQKGNLLWRRHMLLRRQSGLLAGVHGNA